AGADDMPADLREAIDVLRSTQPDQQSWSQQWRDGATTMWAEQAIDPIEAVTVTDGAGQQRTYTGDPVADGFVSGRGAADDFLRPDGSLTPVTDMTAAQRTAYERWLTSPAVVANIRGGRTVVFGGNGG
nr:hypothetical protein [Micromonospora sp. DSM 115978]